MTVAENLLLGRTPRRLGLVDRRGLNRRAREALARVGLDVSPQQRLGELGVARQQLVEIAKALTLEPRIVVLDEPTPALTGPEIERLFGVVRELRGAGVPPSREFALPSVSRQLVVKERTSVGSARSSPFRRLLATLSPDVADHPPIPTGTGSTGCDADGRTNPRFG